MTLVPSLADSSDHFINHCGTVSSLCNTRRRTGSISAGNNGVVNILAVGDTGSGQNQNILVNALDALESSGKEIPLNIVTISPDGRIMR